MSTQKPSSARTHLRRAATALPLGVAGLVLAPTAALADTPASLPDAPDVSGFEYLLVFLLIPLGLFAVITLLAALPSMIRDKGYEPGQAWRSEPEWFGGPRKGVEAAEDVSAGEIEAGKTDRGGASGTW